MVAAPHIDTDRWGPDRLHQATAAGSRVRRTTTFTDALPRNLTGEIRQRGLRVLYLRGHRV